MFRMFGLFLTTACLLTAQPVRADSINWLTDYKTARLEAAAKSRLLVIHFTTANCYWCRRLEAETLNHGNIISPLNKKCVSLKVDGRRDPSLIEALHIKSYPTVVFASSDGRILEIQEGFEDASRFQVRLQRCLAAVETLERLAKDYQEALRALKDGESAKAFVLLKGITADGKDRPIQIKAKQTIQEMENQASEQMSQVRSKTDKEDTHALATQPTPATNARTQRAREQLALAQEDWRAGQYLACLEGCDRIIHDYPDLNEGAEALRLVSSIKSDSERMKGICDKLGEKLATLYLEQAEALAAKGNVDQAIQCLERVVRMFPGSAQSAKTQERIQQLQNRLSGQREAQKQQ